jgi:ABC-type oligopeptide transport system substrate-binding subunit
VSRARQLVRASGTWRTPVTVWVLNSYPPNVAVTRYLAGVLDLIGYHAAVHVATDYHTFTGRVLDSRNQVQGSMSGWIADYPSPIDFFGILLTCRAFVHASKASLNDSEFCDHRLDGLVRQAEAAQATDPTRAVELWQKADQEAVNRAPWVPLTNALGLDVISPQVGNYQHNSQWGTLLDQLWVK